MSRYAIYWWNTLRDSRGEEVRAENISDAIDKAMTDSMGRNRTVDEIVRVELIK